MPLLNLTALPLFLYSLGKYIIPPQEHIDRPYLSPVFGRFPFESFPDPVKFLPAEKACPFGCPERSPDLVRELFLLQPPAYRRFKADLPAAADLFRQRTHGGPAEYELSCVLSNLEPGRYGGCRIENLF